MATPNRRRAPAARKPDAPKPATRIDQGEIQPGGTTEAAAPATPVPSTDWVEIEAQMETEREDLVRDLRDIAQIEDIQYDHLLGALRNAGWFFRLHQVSAVPHTNGGTLVTFVIEIGRSPARTQRIDEFSLLAPGNNPEPSTWARLNAVYSALYILFNRLPPMPAKGETPEAPAPRNENVDVADTGSNTDGFGTDWEPLELVESRAADGMPTFFDPFALGDPPEDIIESVVRILEREVPEISGLEGLAALYTVNQAMFEYVRDMAPDRMPEVTEILNKRRDELTPEPAPARTGRAPRRG